MRSVFFLIVVTLLTATSALAGQFGPAQAQTRPGQIALGLGAFAYADEWDLEGITADVRQTQAFVQLNLGLFPGWEIYLRGGGADLRVDKVLGGSDFSGSAAAFGTAGLKGLFRKGRYMDLGGFAEGSYFLDYEDDQDGTEISIDDSFAVNAGVTFQKEIEGALLYAGPFFHYRQADFDSTIDISEVQFSGTAEEERNLGAFLGIRWVALKDIVVETEVQLRNKISAGAALTFLF